MKKELHPESLDFFVFPLIINIVLVLYNKLYVLFILRDIKLK